MLKRFSTLFLAFSLTLAQSPASNSNSTGNLPTDIRQSCSQFLDNLNSNSEIATCIASLSSATEKFRPGGNAATASSTDVNNAIGAICSPAMATSCPDSLMRGELAQFYTQCQEELTTKPDENVIDIYEILFALSPLRKAVCSKDDNDNYCIRQKIGSNYPGSPDLQSVLNNLVVTTPRSATVSPNMTTYRELNIAFLDLSPGLDESTLCTTCTRQIFNSYYNFEMASPFAPGLSASTLLGNQMELYHAIQNKCGSNFLQTNIQAAGGISGNSLFSGAARIAVSPAFFLAVCGLITISITLAI